MIDLAPYNVSTSVETNIATPSVPVIYRITGMDFTKVKTWSPPSETLYDDKLSIPFTTSSVEPNGVMMEQLTAIMIHRLESFQAGNTPCLENDVTLMHLRSALASMNRRASAAPHKPTR